MNKLDEYIKLNQESFDDQELPDGHLERFENRLQRLLEDSSKTPQTLIGEMGDGIKKRNLTGLFLGILSASVAAALAAVVIFNHTAGAGKTQDWFAGVGNNQVEICDVYYSRVAELYEDIAKSHPDGILDGDMRSVAEESVSMIDLLPDEISDAERAVILKDYYSNLLDGLVEISNIK